MKKLRYIILILAIILLVLVSIALYNKLVIRKFVRLLSKNDATNYTIEQDDGYEITTTKVKDKVLLLESENTLMWISEKENKRVVADKIYKTAIVTENSKEPFKVDSLNGVYINDFFENPDLNFKYLGKEDGYYKVSFTWKGTVETIILYINKENGMVEKREYLFSDDVKNVVKLKIDINNVTQEDVAYPDLTEYSEGISSSTN